MTAFLTILEALIADPTVDAEIIAAAKTVYSFFQSMTPAAVAAAETAAGVTADQQVADSVAGIAADDAAALAQLAALLNHPVVMGDTALATAGEKLRLELAARAMPVAP